MVNFQPDGYHTVTPYFCVDGAADALEFYETILGAEVIEKMTAPDGTIGHAELKIGDSIVMLSDPAPEQGAEAPEAYGGSPVSFYVYVEDCDAVYKEALEAGATGKQEPEDKFWGDRYGSFVDPWGHTWSVGTHIKDMTQEEIEAAAAAQFGG